MTEGFWVAIIGAIATVCAAALAAYIQVRSKRPKHSGELPEPPSFLLSTPAPAQVSESLDRLHQWAATEPPPSKWWPTAWSNIEVRVVLEELALGLRCDDKDMGQFRVFGVDTKLREVLHLEGKNVEGAEPEVGLNRLNLPAELRCDLFHAARCKRKHKRTGNLDYLRGYEYFLRRIAAWSHRLEHRDGPA
jgi:hypothetical protein